MFYHNTHKSVKKQKQIVYNIIYIIVFNINIQFS